MLAGGNMLHVLTLSTLFPNALQPNLGLFVQRQTAGLAARPDVELQVVAPVGLPLWPLSLHPHYRSHRRLPRFEMWQGLPVHRPTFPVWPVWGRHRAGIDLALALLPALRVLRRSFPFDLIDAEFFWPDGPAAVRLGEALGVPVSIKARGSDILFWGDQPRIGPQLVEAGRRATAMLAVSDRLREQMVERGLPAERIRVHNTGIDRGRFAPRERGRAKAELGVAGLLIACVGALVPRKGQKLAIEALASLPSARLVLIGEGPERAALEARARELGLQDRTIFTGAIPHERVADWLAAADLAVQPSESEGLANAWVEALASGTPVVTCDVGGAREVIDRPEAGRLVARNSQAIAQAIGEILADPPAPEEVKKAADRFSWERNADELFDHLSGIVRRR